MYSNHSITKLLHVFCVKDLRNLTIGILGILLNSIGGQTGKDRLINTWADGVKSR